MAHSTVTEHVAKTADHTTFYLAAGPEDGPLVVFAHGWPELSISWRHQLPVFAGLGFRAVAPEMRGYGRSTVHDRTEDYTQQAIVGDMLALLDHLGRDTAVWVGHDWGSPVVWNLASHHPDRASAVASLCVPYATVDRGLDALLPLIDRDVYPEAEYPVGQWDYMRFYEENFDKACAAFDANPYLVAKLLFHKGDPDGAGRPAITSAVRRAGGWFGDGPLPDVPADPDVASEQDLRSYATALQRNGFFGPNAWYVNHERTAAYAAEAVKGGRLDLPALFIGATHDFVVETAKSRLAEPMRGLCSDLTERQIPSGHWMAQEEPAKTNAALVQWLATRVPSSWPR
jgi:pimeloyl-ACP methyl ester carboxylesterase